MDQYFWPVLAAWLWFFGGWLAAAMPCSIRYFRKNPWEFANAVLVAILWPLMAPLLMASRLARGIRANIDRARHARP